MDSTKNFFDAWVNTQSKIVDNLIDTSKKLQESFHKGNVVEKSVEIYNDWFNSQKSIAETLLTSMKHQIGGEEKTKLWKEWLNTQLELGKKWIEIMAVNKENPTFKSIEPSFFNFEQIFRQWNGFHKHFFNSNISPFQMMNFNFNGLSGNPFSNVFDATKTYTQMFELWQPIYKMIQSNSMGVESLSKMLDMDKYKSILDGMFQLMTPEKSNTFFEMTRNYSQMISAFLGDGMQNMAVNPLGQIRDSLLSHLFDKNFPTLAQMNYNLSEQVQKILLPFITMIPAGREKDIATLMFHTQDKYSKYYIKSLEMQNLVYLTGQSTMEKAVKEMMTRAQEKADLVNYDEFYNYWIDSVETDFIQLFGSDSYSRLQGDLLKIGLEIKAQLDKQMELLIAPFPVVPRSEMDELAQTVYRLKNKVRELENKLNDVLSKSSNKKENAKENTLPAKEIIA